MKIIANIPYTGGTDMEFATIKGRDYAFAGSWSRRSRTAAVFTSSTSTNPEKAKEVAWLKCSVSQGDIQISHDNKYVIQAPDSTGGPESCLGVGKLGFMIVDITNPKKPKPIGIAEIPNGSHNMTAHPTKPYVYNSNSALAGEPFIQIWSIKNPKKPELVNTFDSRRTPRTTSRSTATGRMAVTAAISHIDIFDTSDPENPVLLVHGPVPRLLDHARRQVHPRRLRHRHR